MKKDDIRNIAMFIILILLIGLISIYNDYKNRRIDNVDRKITKIFNTYSYKEVLNEGKYLFLNAIKLISNDFDYERNENNTIKYYSFPEYLDYKKILYFRELKSTFTDTELDKYMKNNNIVEIDNSYYTDNKENKKDYIGSKINISSYDDNYVYFTSKNYYCENTEYIGLLDSEPSCEYRVKETTFTVVNSNNNLRINNFEDISKIIA